VYLLSVCFLVPHYLYYMLWCIYSLHVLDAYSLGGIVPSPVTCKHQYVVRDYIVLTTYPSYVLVHLLHVSLVISYYSYEWLHHYMYPIRCLFLRETYYTNSIPDCKAERRTARAVLSTKE